MLLTIVEAVLHVLLGLLGMLHMLHLESGDDVSDDAVANVEWRFNEDFVLPRWRWWPVYDEHGELSASQPTLRASDVGW